MPRRTPLTRADLVPLEGAIAILNTDVAGLKTDVAVLKTDVAVLKTDVAVLKTDVAELKTDVAILKTDVAILKTDVAGLRSDLDASTKRLALEIVKTNDRVAHLESSLREEMRQNTDRILGAIDAFARKGENYDKTAVLHGQVLTEVQLTLKDHSRRIGALEANPPR